MNTPHRELVALLQTVGKDPSRLIFEDELTGLNNRRFLRSFFEHKVDWNGDADFPLSLLMLDLDHFKQINDTHGHEAGDQVLLWLSSLMRDICSDGHFPIRYGGDEFMILVPSAQADEARMLADVLLQRIKTRPFQLRDVSATLPITLSVGVACAPADARDGEGLIHRADAALYHAKNSGRSRAANAHEVDPAHLFPKAALRRLNSSGVVSRDAELQVVSGALAAVAEGKSQWLVFEGGPGSGKSAMLRTIRKNLEGDASLRLVNIAGVQQEEFRPYYLLINILIALLSDPDIDSAGALAGLTAEQSAHLSILLPQLGDTTVEEAGAKRREGIFTTASGLIATLTASRPLALLIDDLEFADESTLYLLRGLMRRPDLTVLVCGSAMEMVDLADGTEELPLKRFRARYERELEINSVRLRPLESCDIATHLNTVFPGLNAPDALVSQLVTTTQGNPLFLSEVIRKLVLDQKVSLAGQEWAIRPLEDGYLPRSLEDIVAQKIDALDESGRELLAHASTLGEEVPVSLLTGASERSEHDVLAFLDRAEDLGLLQQDFQLNDENMRFLGKRVLEICHGQIGDDRRQQLHERAGAYQEELNEDGLWPAASLLAYHFKRSANQAKARQYDRMQATYRETVFNPVEAAGYSADTDVDEEVEARLTPDSLPRIPSLLRTLVGAVRAIQLYPAESRAAIDARRHALEAIAPILVGNRRIHLARVDRALLVNGQRLDVSEYGSLARSFLNSLEHAELKGICFENGLTETELGAFLEAFSQAKPETIDHSFWSRFCEEKSLAHVRLEQMRYASVRRRVSAEPGGAAALPQRELEAAELAELPKVLRAFTGAAINLKLYPVGSQQVADSMHELRETLQPILRSHEACTLGVVNGTLLANGVRVPTDTYQTVATRFVSILDPVELRSITFGSAVTTAELVTLIEALRDPPADIDVKYWQQFARQQGLAGLSLNEQRYKAAMVETVESLVGTPDGGREGALLESLAERVEALADRPAEALRTALPQFGRELLVRGELDLFRRMLAKIYGDFSDLEPATRVHTVRACATLFDNLILALRHRFLKASADFLLQVLAEDDSDRVVAELANLLHGMSASAIQFSDYDLASRIFLALADRRRELELKPGEDTPTTGRALARELNPAVAKVLEEDLVSGDVDRQEPAAQVLGSLGAPAIPLLVDVIKRERKFRTRQMAAMLLRDLGPRAAAQLKQELASEVGTEQRFRILEVLDVVTRRVTDELAYCLGDGSPKIRQAAYQLAERVGDPALVAVIAPHTQSADLDLAQSAIRCLAQLGSEDAARALVATLQSTKQSDRAVACAQALGQIGDPVAVEALAGLLLHKKSWFRGWQWDDQVRTTAAIALQQIDSPEAATALSQVGTDPAPRVRAVAQTATHAGRAAA
jgi:diguanylate cyclase (GGDEF)-like protein